jgi:hypothetical protein
MSKLIKFRSPLPNGMLVFEHGVELVMEKQHLHNAKMFIRRSNRRIYLERREDNSQESNTIRVIGKSQGWFFKVAKCIGYVPTDVADKLVAAGLDDRVSARLQMIIKNRTSIDIRFDLLGHKDDLGKFCMVTNKDRSLFQVRT